MANRRHSRGRLVEDLRLTIDCMPVSTRQAMLDGIQGNERIIVGAYVDGTGGVCPMLAAHRCGGRTDLLSFARAWDRFTRAPRRARRASRRELDILIGQLKDSLESSSGLELHQAIAEHRELAGRRIRAWGRLLQGADPAGEILARRLRGRKGRISSGEDPAPTTDRRLRSPVSSRA
jgi:hypothetical protein